MNVRLLCCALSLLGGSLFSGCGSAEAAPRAVDPAQARSDLAAALDAWKSGTPHGAPIPGREALRLADEDWLSGSSLVDYTLAPDDRAQAVGSTLNIPAQLTLRSPRGRTTKLDVVYQITLEPTPMIMRSGQ